MTCKNTFTCIVYMCTCLYILFERLSLLCFADMKSLICYSSGEVCSYPLSFMSWNDIVHLRDDPGIQSNNFCDSWTPWINLASPQNRTEREPFTPVIKEIFCPSSVGGTVTAFRCRDDKGEAMTERINSTSGDKSFVFSCSINFGIDCYSLSANGTCPDYSYTFYCHCEPATTPSSSTTTAAITTTCRYFTEWK